MELDQIKSIHFTGIKGVAMASMACMAQDLGIKISGSDVKEKFVTDSLLKRRKINWQIGFNKSHLPEKLDLLVYTGACSGKRLAEIKAAQDQNIPTLNHAQALALFLAGKKVISVAGVGGKSTTSAMLAFSLDYLGLRPSYAVGVGEIFPLGDPGRYVKKSQYFVVEADEYVACPNDDRQPRFFYQQPTVLVITNIEHDHPDVYQDIDQTLETFCQLADKLPADGLILANIDNNNVKKFIKQVGRPVQTYGFSDQADWQLVDWQKKDNQQVFNIIHQEVVFGPISLQVPGKFNALNATAALATAVYFGIDAKKIPASLQAFKGTKRRFELIKKAGQHWLYDDYAHHPEEIKATLQMAKNWFADYQIVTIFQPHTFSRTQALFDEFTHSFSNADQIILWPTYSSAREQSGTATSYKLYAAVNQIHKQAFYAADMSRLKTILKTNVKKKSLIITIGAGDIFMLHQELIKCLKELHD